MMEYQHRVNVDYNSLILSADKRCSDTQCLTRIFVVSNSSAGKSSFIESLKRANYPQCLQIVLKSSVPSHTFGMVHSIHDNKQQYGKVLFYDLAGDPEYYSSHTAILEKLASPLYDDNEL